MQSVEAEWSWRVEHESLRRVLRAELRHDTLAGLSRRLDVPTRVLRTILRAGEPNLTQDQWQTLDAFRATHPAREPEPGAVALSILAAALPAGVRERTRADLARRLYDAFTDTGAPLPGWIEEELLAERQG